MKKREDKNPDIESLLLNMHKGLKAKLKEYCKRRGETMTAVIVRAVRKEITTGKD